MEKLRNKKSGEIVKFLSLELVDEDEIEFTYEMLSGHEKAWSYNSLEKFKEEWETYKPAEPLIKDKNRPERAEKARKTLKMWADANSFKKVSYRVDSCVSVFYNECNPAECATTIEFGWIMEGLKLGTYGITELCGEEDE